jgi:hypothetical protein
MGYPVDAARAVTTGEELMGTMWEISALEVYACECPTPDWLSGLALLLATAVYCGVPALSIQHSLTRPCFHHA